jgi:uncharacterized protein YqhQ
VVLIPFIAGASFELMKLGDKYRDWKTFRVLLLPGLMLQRLTTREPTDDQIEVALVALKEALANEGVNRQ